MTATLAPPRPKPNGSAKPPPRLVPVPWSGLRNLPKREPLIRGVLDRGAMSCLYGGSNTGKTFFGLDLAAHVALGWDRWRGKKVRHGGVVYIAAEGGLGIEERLTAFRYHHRVEVEGVPLYVIPEPIDLCSNQADAKLLTSHILGLVDETPIEMIVVDTLSRAMAGGNENAPDDMGRFIRNLDMLRIATGAHVMVVHHSGKDETRGARGHGSLRAACDTEIEVTRGDGTDISTATVVKQRDHALGATFAFRLQQVEIGQHEDGEIITSCVVIPTDAQPTTKRKGQPRLTKAAKIALNALKDAVDDHGMSPPPSNRIPPGVRGVSVNRWRQAAYRIGISTGEDRAKQAAFQRGSEALIGSQLVRVEGDFAWIT